MSTSLDLGDAACAEHVQNHLRLLLTKSPIYSHLFSSATLLHASAGRVVVQVPVEARHLNSKDSLHGSVSATLVDFLGGVAIASYDLRDRTGVSTDMHISFIGGAKVGEVLECEGAVERVGGTLAYTTVTIRKVVPGKGLGEGPLVTKGSHTKYVRTMG